VKSKNTISNRFTTHRNLNTIRNQFKKSKNRNLQKKGLGRGGGADPHQIQPDHADQDPQQPLLSKKRNNQYNSSHLRPAHQYKSLQTKERGRGGVRIRINPNRVMRIRNICSRHINTTISKIRAISAQPTITETYLLDNALI